MKADLIHFNWENGEPKYYEMVPNEIRWLNIWN